jgi:hypothetical protein
LSAVDQASLSATTGYLIAYPTGPLAAATAATHGYTIAFGVYAGLLGLGFILAIVMLRPGAGSPNSGTPAQQPRLWPPRRVVPAQQQVSEAIPVA